MTVAGRAFVAVAPPTAVLDAVEERVAAAREVEGSSALRWSRREQWHITLQFLGRVDDVEAVVDVLDAATRELLASAVRLGGGGAFPDPARANVLWLGASEGADALTALAGAVADATAAVGFSAEPSQYRPHVTLARAKRPRDLRAAVAALGPDPVGSSWRARELVLLASETHPDGARYQEIGRFPLGST